MDGNNFLSLQGRENSLQRAVLRPTAELFVYRGPIPELSGQRPPFAAIFGHIQNCVDKIAVLGLDIAALNGNVAGYPLVLRSCYLHMKIISYVLWLVSTLPNTHYFRLQFLIYNRY